MLGTYYADRFVGRKTACGDIFRQNQYTAAHLTLPMGTYVQVTYPLTGRQVVVRINDRCPKRGILDMTKLACYAVGIKGSGRVVVKTLDAETGYARWMKQDTLLLSAEGYMAFRDRSKPRRISPYPIAPGGSVVQEEPPAVAEVRPVAPRAVAEKPKAPRKADTPKVDRPPQPTEEDEPSLTDSVDLEVDQPVANIELPSPTNTSHLYDIELCIVGSPQAAQREVNRMPKEMQSRVKLQRNPLNGQVHVILCTADSRSHAVRTQAMLIDDYPDSCLIPHEENERMKN